MMKGAGEMMSKDRNHGLEIIQEYEKNTEAPALSFFQKEELRKSINIQLASILIGDDFNEILRKAKASRKIKELEKQVEGLKSQIERASSYLLNARAGDPFGMVSAMNVLKEQASDE